MKFVDEPPASTSRLGSPRAYLTEAVLARLERNPGQWALLGREIPFGSTSAFPRQAPRCEFTRRNTHRNDDGQKVCDVYAKWVG